MQRRFSRFVFCVERKNMQSAGLAMPDQIHQPFALTFDFAKLQKGGKANKRLTTLKSSLSWLTGKTSSPSFCLDPESEAEQALIFWLLGRNGLELIRMKLWLWICEAPIPFIWPGLLYPVIAQESNREILRRTCVDWRDRKLRHEHSHQWRMRKRNWKQYAYMPHW